MLERCDFLDLNVTDLAWSARNLLKMFKSLVAYKEVSFYTECLIAGSRVETQTMVKLQACQRHSLVTNREKFLEDVHRKLKNSGLLVEIKDVMDEYKTFLVTNLGNQSPRAANRSERFEHFDYILTEVANRMCEFVREIERTVDSFVRGENGAKNRRSGKYKIYLKVNKYFTDDYFKEQIQQELILMNRDIEAQFDSFDSLVSNSQISMDDKHCVIAAFTHDMTSKIETYVYKFIDEGNF